MLELLALVLVVAGAALAAALVVLRRQAQRHARLAEALIAQRPRVGADPLAWFEAARPMLEAAGVRGLRYRGRWFASPVEGGWGTEAGEPRVRRFGAGEMALEVALFLRPARGERRLLRAMPLAVFDLLLEQALLGKSEAIAAALARQAELTLYLQHDMKNLAQWLLLLADQFEDAPDERLPARAAHLRQQAPLLRRRAERLVDLMARRAPVDAPESDVELAGEARVFATFHGVELATAGDPGRTRLDRSHLERILDNLFANFAASPGTPPVTLRVERAADRLSAVFRQPAELAIPPERIFEPLASGRAQGTGLGLYQARLAALALGGDLQAQPTSDGLAFVLTLPTP